MQRRIGKPFLVGFQHAGMAAETGRLRALAERADFGRLHLVGAVAAGAHRRIAVLGTAAAISRARCRDRRCRSPCGTSCRELARSCRRALDDRMRIMAIGADRRRRIAAAHQRGVNAALPLLELVGMTAAADLGHGDGKAARTSISLSAGRMRGGINVGVTAGAADALWTDLTNSRPALAAEVSRPPASSPCRRRRDSRGKPGPPPKALRRPPMPAAAAGNSGKPRRAAAIAKRARASLRNTVRVRDHIFRPHRHPLRIIQRRPGGFRPPGGSLHLFFLPHRVRRFIDLSHAAASGFQRCPATDPGQRGQSDEGKKTT